MQLSESKTLENLKTAFANESAAMVRYEIFPKRQNRTAMRKYRRFSAPQQETKRLTHKYGSDLSTEEYPKPLMLLKRRCTAKTTSGRRCIRSMPKPQDRKDLTI